MSSLFPKDFFLKNGKKIVIRGAEIEDSEALLKCSKTIFKDDKYFLTTKEEAEDWWSIEKTADRIKRYIGQKGKILLVAVIDGIIVGQTAVECGEKHRTQHVGKIGMSILPEYRQIGVGTALMQSIIDWAKEDSIIEKLELSVFATNEGAIGLYKKMGFAEEGREIRKIKLGNGRYVDTILMYKFVK